MSDRRDEDRMPPIPDGGLSDSMPEWLRRPPAWRTLKDADVVQTEPERASGLPEADTSVIDPRTFLTDDDLPDWLRNLASRRRPVEPAPSGDDEAIAAFTATNGGGSESGQATVEDEVREAPRKTADTPARFVPRTPSISASEALSPRRRSNARPTPTGTSRTAPSATRWWQGTPMILLLTVLLLVAIGVIVAMSVA